MCLDFVFSFLTAFHFIKKRHLKISGTVATELN